MTKKQQPKNKIQESIDYLLEQFTDLKWKYARLNDKYELLASAARPLLRAEQAKLEMEYEDAHKNYLEYKCGKIFDTKAVRAATKYYDIKKDELSEKKSKLSILLLKLDSKSIYDL